MFARASFPKAVVFEQDSIPVGARPVLQGCCFDRPDHWRARRAHLIIFPASTTDDSGVQPRPANRPRKNSLIHMNGN